MKYRVKAAPPKDKEKIISYASYYIRWYFLAYIWGLIFSCLVSFVEQSFFPYMPSNMVIGVLTIVVFKPLLFIIIARTIARKRLAAEV